MLFSDLQKITNGKLRLNEDAEISKFSADTRSLTGHPSEVFIAVRGKRDGHNFIEQAIQKGVKSFIVEKELTFENINSLEVENSIKAFHEVAKSHRAKFDIPIVGITGSNGKTTVKEWLSTILSQKFYVVKSPKSYNSQIGVPLSLLEIRKNHEIGVFEAGISKRGEMAALSNMIDPKIGIFTNLGHAHDDGFNGKDEKLREKLKLFNKSEELIYRSDQSYSQRVESTHSKKLISWSLDDTGIHRVRWKHGIISIDDHSFSCDFETENFLENLTHAIIAALEIGMEADAIQKGIDLIENIPMRLELKKGINGCYILDDTYNNDEIGLKVALDYLETQKQNEKRTVILSDILHAGKSDKELYGQVADVLNRRNISRLVGVGPRIERCKDMFHMPATFFSNTDSLIKNLPEFENEMILVKGARDFALERVVQRLEEKSHGTVLEVNFEALQHNLNQYRALLKPSTKLMVMVKANAYGSGILEVANFLQHQRVDLLGVAYVDEAIQLRKNGITIPIMIMNPYIESFEHFERYDLQAEIFSMSHLKRMLADTTDSPKIHIKIDTGMHRLGFSEDQVDELLDELKQNPDVKVEGIFTHFSSSDLEEEDAFTIGQAEVFERVCTKIVNALGYSPTKHACNSPAIVRWPQYHYDMVRLGIGLHGFDPTGKLSLRNSSSLKTVISQIQNLKKGDTVGYSRKGKIEKNSRIAVLPIGYEDGFSRFFGNGHAKVNVNGWLCPTIGNICMDMMMVDVSDTDVKEGDPVIIFGEEPNIRDLANWAGTIPYEILTNVSNRVKRVFISE